MLIFLCLFLNLSYAQTMTSTIKIVGVDKEGNGIEGNLTVEIQPGKGRVLVDISPLQGFYTQDSERKAVKVAADMTKFNFSNYDVIYSIKTPNVMSVDGPSAGAAMAIATIAAIQNKTLSQSFSITGTIEEDHSIGKVGMVFAKAKAAADAGITRFLIPKGQAEQIEYVRKVRTPAPGWRIETIEPIRINIIKYAKENWDMDIYEVSTIEEALKYAFEEMPTIKRTKIEETKFNLSFTSPLKSYEEFEHFARSALSRAEANYNKANTKLTHALLSDDLKAELEHLLKISKELKDEGKELLNKGYKYSAGNNGFKSSIYSQTIIDLVNYYSSSPENREIIIENKIRDVKGELEAAKKEVEKSLFAACDTKNRDWAIFALQRINYAENRLNKLSADSEESVFFDINVAKEWIIISKEFASKIEFYGNDECMQMFEKDARKLIDETENKLNLLKVLRKNVYNSESYLEASKIEYEKGQYMVALIDASIAMKRVEAVEKFDGKDIEEIYKEFDKVNITPTNLLSTIFYEHAIFTLHKAIENDSREEALDAIQILYSMLATEEVYNKINQKIKANQKEFDWNQAIIVFLLLCLSVSIAYILFLKSKIKKSKLKKSYKKSKRK